MLTSYPNMVIDVSGRMAELGRQPRASARLISKHRERVLFGTDTFPPPAPLYRHWYRFLESDDEHFPYSVGDGPPSQGRWAVSALNLPAEVLEPVYRTNARRVLGLELIADDDGDARLRAPVRAALIFAASAGLIGLSFGVLARTSGLLARDDLRDVARSSSPAARSSSRWRRSPRAAPRSRPCSAGSCSTPATCPTGSRSRRSCAGRSGSARSRARSCSTSRPRSRSRSRRPSSGRLAFYACGCALFVTWNLGTLVGALAGGAIADPSALGLDAAFPASMVALLAPLLRRREMRAAALAGGALALAATPFTAPGVPILLAAAGALAARFVRGGRGMTWWAVFTLAAGTYVLKAAGPLALGSRTVPPPLQRALNLVSVTLLAALVAISTFGQGRSLVLDARAAGLGVALGASGCGRHSPWS